MFITKTFISSHVIKLNQSLPLTHRTVEKSPDFTSVVEILTNTKLQTLSILFRRLSFVYRFVTCVDRKKTPQPLSDSH